MVEDLYADDLYEEEEESLEGEGTNRTFLMLAGGLGGLLALAICVFAVWAFVINPRMTADRVAQNAAIEQTNEAIQAANGGGTTLPEGTATETPVPVATEALEPTATPVPPTNTPRPTATPEPATPTPSEEEAATMTVEAEAALAEGGATATPAEVAEGPVSSKATAVPTQVSSKQGIPETGVGTFGIGALAIGLLLLLVVVRRVRRAV
jgi:hypothetical protein